MNKLRKELGMFWNTTNDYVRLFLIVAFCTAGAVASLTIAHYVQPGEVVCGE